MFRLGTIATLKLFNSAMCLGSSAEQNVHKGETNTFSKYKVEHMLTIQLPVRNNIIGLAPSGKNKIWIAVQAFSDVFLVTHRGELVSQRVPVGEDDSCVNGTGDGEGSFLVSTSHGSIQRVQPSGIVTKVLGIEDVQGIAGKLGRVFCAYPCKDKNCVGEVTPNKTITKIVESECPLFIAADPKSDLLCLSDSDVKQVVCFTVDGKIVSRYKSGSMSFDPKGVCFDRQGCIIIADKGGRCIERINKDAELVQTLVKNLMRPQSVVVDPENTLWIGLSDGEVKAYKLS